VETPVTIIGSYEFEIGILEAPITEMELDHVAGFIGHEQRNESIGGRLIRQSNPPVLDLGVHSDVDATDPRLLDEPIADTGGPAPEAHGVVGSRHREYLVERPLCHCPPPG
jgi:hypothetical protein